MKQIEWFWNRMYFSIFDFNKETQLLLNRFVDNLLKHIFCSKKTFVRMPPLQFWLLQELLSDYVMIIFTCLLFWSLANFVSILFPCLSLVHLDKKTFILVCAVPCLLINYVFLWRKDRHLKYFELFAKENRKVKRKWNYITLVCLLLSFVMFIFSMIVMGR